jgi:hypothetical protein
MALLVPELLNVIFLGQGFFIDAALNPAISGTGIPTKGRPVLLKIVSASLLERQITSYSIFMKK